VPVGLPNPGGVSLEEGLTDIVASQFDAGTTFDSIVIAAFDML